MSVAQSFLLFLCYCEVLQLSGKLKEVRKVMLMELYYEHYADNCHGIYWDMSSKSLPYMVLIHDFEKRQKFHDFLKSEGFQCVTWNYEYPGVLVNMNFRRFGLICRACRYGCVNNRNYSLEEFMSEVYRKPDSPVIK